MQLLTIQVVILKHLVNTCFAVWLSQQHSSSCVVVGERTLKLGHEFRLGAWRWKARMKEIATSTL